MFPYFAKHTLVPIGEQSVKEIQEVKIDDVLYGNRKVTGVIVLKYEGTMYTYKGIHGSGSSYDGKWISMKCDGEPCHYSLNEVYSLLTSDHCIPVLDDTGSVIEFIE